MTQPRDLPVRTHTERMRRLAETRERIVTLPAGQAMQAILEHPQPAALVHSFPEEDLHFLIHDIGVEDALPLIRLASNRQWEYFLDMEAWRKDQLNYPLTTTWLQLLLRADPDRLVTWCLDEKLDFMELYLFRNIELRVREADQSPSDLPEGFFTDDDTYYVRLVDYPVTTPEEESVKASRDALVGQLLRRLSVADHVRYQGLLMEAVGVIPAETEEELFRLRNGRLAEKGFLPFHEAIGVYQPLRRGDLQAAGKKVLPRPRTEDPRMPVPQFAARFLDADTLFVRALKGIHEPHVIDTLQMELAGLCNRVVAADQAIIRSRHALGAVVAKVSGYLTIGLECLMGDAAGNREAAAAALLRHHFLADIFRIGYAEALQLHWRATRWRRESWWQASNLSLGFWDEAGLGLLGGLLIARPQYYDPGQAATHYREFRSRAEIEATRERLEQVIAVDRLLGGMGVPLNRLAGIRFLTYRNLLLTLWARAWLELPPAADGAPSIALPLARFQSFYTALWTDREGRRRIGDEKKREFLEWAAKASGTSGEALSDRLGGVFEALFDEVERELGPVKAGNLDPRHVHLFLLHA